MIVHVGVILRFTCYWECIASVQEEREMNRFREAPYVGNGCYFISAPWRSLCDHRVCLATLLTYISLIYLLLTFPSVFALSCSLSIFVQLIQHGHPLFLVFLPLVFRLFHVFFLFPFSGVFFFAPFLLVLVSLFPSSFFSLMLAEMKCIFRHCVVHVVSS